MKQSATLKIWAFRANTFTGLHYLFAFLVSWWTNSEWSHIGFSIDDVYYEADYKTGVTKANHVRFGAQLIYTCIAPRSIIDWSNRQVGKQYDLWGVLGFVVNVSDFARKHKNMWFCSELGTAVLRKSKIRILEGVSACKVYPGKLVVALQKL